jgi:DNA-binding protein HU-beta
MRACLVVDFIANARQFLVHDTISDGYPGRRRFAVTRALKFARGAYMNKGDLIESVSADAGLSKADASRAVESMISAITAALKGGNQVSLVGFGTFTVKKRAARTGRNPRTGETIEIRASKVPGFRAGKALKDAVN